MCFFRRIIYSRCAHYRSLGPDPARKCYVQLAYECGEVEMPCGKLWHHGYVTTRLDGLCKGCDVKMGKACSTLTTFKDKLAQARLQLENVHTRKTGSREAGGDDDDDDDESMSPVSVQFTAAPKMLASLRSSAPESEAREEA